MATNPITHDRQRTENDGHHAAQGSPIEPKPILAADDGMRHVGELIAMLLRRANGIRACATPG
jgi:hypothetical protein